MRGFFANAQNDNFLLPLLTLPLGHSAIRSLYHKSLSRRKIWNSGLVEDHGVEAVADEEACVLVELDGLEVGFGYGEGDGGETGTGEVVDAVLEEGDAEALPAIGGRHAELRDVRHVIGYARA